MENIRIEELITEKDVMIKYQYFLDYGLVGDPVEQLIYMFWDDEDGFGNPYDLTEQEHDDIIRPYVEKYLSQYQTN